MKLIDKDALVAEIKELQSKLNLDSPFGVGGYTNLRTLLDRVDTLEVKEVDLEHLGQEVEDFCYRFDDRKEAWYNMTPHDKNLMVLPTFANFAMQLAKHFFELGMAVSNKSQKGV